MTEIIDTVQLQEIGDGLIDLFEVEIRGETIYMYGGFDGAGQSVQFADAGGTLRTYYEFPIEVEGLDWTSDGASSRPTLRIANVLSLIALMNDDTSDIGNEAAYLGIVRNEDLLGARVTRRRTLEKYLGIAGTPTEFPKQIFILDRISAENNIVVEFELASPFDVEGVKLPNRVVVGKYCSWEYQGATKAINPCGGCTWPQNSRGVYLDKDDNPIGAAPAWSSVTTYTPGDKVTYGNYKYECIRDNLDKVPENFPPYWKRIDLCGKTITSCKLRFQDSGDTSIPLPFGGFPGSAKFK